MKDIVILYMPVVHRGYLNYLESTGVKDVYVLQASDLPEFPQISREVRALTLTEITLVLDALGYKVHPYSVLQEKGIPQGARVFMPEDDITRSLTINAQVIWGSWFLRWDWSKSTAIAFVQPEADRVISKDHSQYAMYSARMRKLLKEAKKSSDVWRQVVAMVVSTSGQNVICYNKHYPNERAPYEDGDPRDSFSPGEFIEISTAMHGEQACIAEAAKRGISLEGAELYVSTFPCNLCAPWIVVAGFKYVFFTGGYSNLNGQRTLREHGVELIYVEL